MWATSSAWKLFRFIDLKNIQSWNWRNQGVSRCPQHGMLSSRSNAHRCKQERQDVCLRLSYVPITHMMVSVWNNMTFLESWFLPSFLPSLFPSCLLFSLPSLPAPSLSFLGQSKVYVGILLWVVSMRGWQLGRIPDKLAGFLPQHQAQSVLSKGAWNWVESFPRDHGDYRIQRATESTKYSVYPFVWKQKPRRGVWGVKNNSLSRPFRWVLYKCSLNKDELWWERWKSNKALNKYSQ